MSHLKRDIWCSFIILFSDFKNRIRHRISHKTGNLTEKNVDWKLQFTHKTAKSIDFTKKGNFLFQLKFNLWHKMETWNIYMLSSNERNNSFTSHYPLEYLILLFLFSLSGILHVVLLEITFHGHFKDFFSNITMKKPPTTLCYIICKTQEGTYLEIKGKH